MMLEEVFVETEEDPRRGAILDSGCTKTMHGSAWGRRYEKELEKLGLVYQVKSREQSFKGVGGQVRSTTAKIYPIGINRVHGEMYPVNCLCFCHDLLWRSSVL